MACAMWRFQYTLCPPTQLFLGIVDIGASSGTRPRIELGGAWRTSELGPSIFRRAIDRSVERWRLHERGLSSIGMV